MQTKKNGFTIVELLAVIVVLAIIITVASSSVISVVNNSRKKMASEVRNNLKESALTYSMDHLHLEKCDPIFSEEMVNNNITNLNASSNATCIQKVTVEEVKNAGVFEDKRGFCDNSDVVIIYRYNSGEYSEYKAYVSDDACNN